MEEKKDSILSEGEINNLPENRPSGYINRQIELMKREGVLDTNLISDGYHTFGELYEHRCRLFVALLHYVSDYEYTWKSKKHSDGSEIDGWFVAGIGRDGGKQITYHLPVSMWEDEQLKYAAELDKAPEFDGHTSADVLERLKIL